MIWIRMWLPDHYFIFFTIAVWRILGHFKAFLIQSLGDLYRLGEMTDAEKIMHLQHFGTDPTDLRIWINPKIWIRIPYHFRLKFWHW